MKDGSCMESRVSVMKEDKGGKNWKKTIYIIYTNKVPQMKYFSRICIKLQVLLLSSSAVEVQIHVKPSNQQPSQTCLLINWLITYFQI